MKKFNKQRMLYAVLAVFLVGLFLFFSYARVFDDLEYSTLDFRYMIRPNQPVDNDIVIIEIGDDSIAKIERWPFSRNYHELLVQALTFADVKTIVFDIFFSEPKDEDAEFARAIANSGRVHLPYVFEIDRTGEDKKHTYASGYAAALLKTLGDEAKNTGFVNVEPDLDGKIRRVPPFMEYGDKRYPHLTVQVALNDIGYTFDQVEIIPGKRIIVDEDTVIPLCEDSSMLVDYPAVWGKAFRHYSYVDVLQSYLADVTGQQPAMDLKELKGSTCFIGMTATASPDAHPSPLEPIYPGVGVHTTIYNSIVNGTFLRRLGRWPNLFILVLLWLATILITEKASKRFAILSILLLMTSFIAIAIVFFWPFGIWIDLFYPIVTIAVIYVVGTFRKYVMETQRRELIEKELNIAEEIQQSFLPKTVAGMGGVDISVRMLTARQVGGDLYDIIQLDDKKMGIMLGDVSGKGVPAALYMAKAVSVFRTFVRDGETDEVLTKVNNRLVEDGSSSLFVTLTYMKFDTETNTATYSIGGHMPTLLIEPDGNVELLDVEEGMPLGMIECDFSIAKRKYKKGSVFVLYTDGVTEAMDIKGEMFEMDRLTDLGKTLVGKSPEEVVAAIHKAVDDFAGKAKQHDDITVMAIKT